MTDKIVKVKKNGVVLFADRLSSYYKICNIRDALTYLIKDKKLFKDSTIVSQETGPNAGKIAVQLPFHELVVYEVTLEEAAQK